MVYINSAGLSVKVLSTATTSKLGISSSHIYVPSFSIFEQHSPQGCFFNMYTHVSIGALSMNTFVQ